MTLRLKSLSVSYSRALNLTKPAAFTSLLLGFFPFTTRSSFSGTHSFFFRTVKYSDPEGSVLLLAGLPNPFPILYR